MTRAGSVLIAALLLVSTVAVGFGPGLASAQTDTYAQEFTTGPHKVAIDLSNVTTETTVSVITSESPAGDNATIMKKTVSGSEPSAHFRNAGAYEAFTIQVSGADAKPGFSKGGVSAAWTPGSPGKFLGDTGGDPGFTYDLSERIGESVMPQVVQLDRTGLPGTTTVNTTGTDASQTKLDIYQSAQNSKAQSDAYRTTLDNYLADTKTQARIIGKNAYIRELNNGSSKAAAKTAAKQAVADYYATKQKNLLSEYSAQAENLAYLSNTASTEGLNSGFIAWEYNKTEPRGYYVDVWTEPTVQGVETRTITATLANGDTKQYSAPMPKTSPQSGSKGIEIPKQAIGVAETSAVWVDTGAAAEDKVTYSVAYIKAPNSNYNRLNAFTQQDYATAWSSIETQNTQVQNDMGVLANNTYSAYQSGEINSSDLVDPYILASQQSAGDDFQGWAAAQLTLTGTNSPENFDQIGSFNVTTESGTQYEGVLFSQENPASGQFETNTTYNPNQIGGTQYVVTSDRIVELKSNFTVDDITTTDGKNVQNVTIEKTQYKTTNVSELKQQYEDLAYKRAQIEAREKALKQSAGGGLLGGGSVSPVVALAVIGTLLAVVVLQD